jgi:hypothetical protein
MALIGAGIVSIPAVTQADEATNAVPALLTSLASTTLSGYVDTSAHWNPGNGNNNLPTYSPNGVAGGAKADGFNLNVVNVTLSHPAGDGWSAGYNATLLMGPDATGYNTSVFSHQSSVFSANSDFGLKDTYVDLHAPVGNGLDVKLGTFSEPLGYEVYETGNNPNYTRSYGYEIEPTALTGVLATYQVFGPLSASFGIANTWSSGIDSRANPPQAESYKTYLGSLTYTFPTNTGFLAGSTVSGGIINGYDAVNAVIKTSYYIGGTINTPINNLKAGFAFDYCTLGDNTLGTDPATGAPVAEDHGYQEAFGLYLSYQATEKLSLYTRGEVLKQSGYLGNPNTTGTGGTYSGMPSGAYEVTQTVQYDLWKNVLARLEFRWDHSEHGHPYGGSLGGFDAATGTYTPPAGGLENEFLLAANFVYKF